MKKDRRLVPNDRLREARIERGWSQEKLAEKIGVSTVEISRWEHGTAFPFPIYRERLCEAFGKTTAELGLLQSPQPVVRIWTVPIARNPFFTGREALLEALRQRLSTERAAALTQAQALSGLGGIGKTQTAAEYAYRYGDEYSHVFWVRAATRETLVADFVSLAEQLALPEQEEQEQQHIVAAVKRWLANHENWLLILDNADDLPLAQEFLPRRHKGYVLFTTRAQAAGQIAASVEVEQLDLAQGTLLLLRWSKRLNMDTPLAEAQVEDRVAAEDIVKEMEGLPLALVQAAAYMEETGCTLPDYLQRYATHRKTLLARRSALVLDYPETVATTWALSFLRVEQQSPAAADFLRLCAFLAPDAIPEELLTRGGNELGPVLAPASLDPLQLDEALEVLRRYSLVRRDGRTHILSIHRLVQAVLRDSMNQESQRIWAERIVRAINVVFPEIDFGTEETKQYYLPYYLPHIQECATLIEQYNLNFQEAAKLLYKTGIFLYVYGFYPQSQSFHQHALRMREQMFGSDHPDVAESLNNLAMFARFQGDYEQAEGFHRRALAIRERTLGPDDPKTAQSLNNLAVLYRNQGKYEQAEPLLRQALNIREQSLGSEHPNTLLTSINLAKLYIQQGKYTQAEPLVEQALAISERVLESGNHLISQSLSLKARLAFEQGNYEQAEILWQQALTIVEKTFGPEHPSTAERLNDLAELAVAQGRFTQAESLCRRAMRICEKSLGPKHPDTTTYRQHLSRIQRKKEEEQEDDHPPAPSAP